VYHPGAGIAFLRGTIMRAHYAVLLTAAALIPLAAPRARADSGWSGAAHFGLAFPQHQGASVTSGGWVDLLHTFLPNASAGVEAGYLKLPEATSYVILPWARYAAPTDDSRDMFSASAAVRLRSVGPAGAHMIGTFGYYHLSVPSASENTGSPGQPAHEWNPGFSLGLGFSASGLVRPSFQLRWHETIGPDDTNLDVVTFEVGLHFD
jgi:hypothetical protein